MDVASAGRAASRSEIVQTTPQSTFPSPEGVSRKLRRRVAFETIPAYDHENHV